MRFGRTTRYPLPWSGSATAPCTQPPEYSPIDRAGPGAGVRTFCHGLTLSAVATPDTAQTSAQRSLAEPWVRDRFESALDVYGVTMRQPSICHVRSAAHPERHARSVLRLASSNPID